MLRLFGDKLRYLRRQHRLTQTDLSRQLDLASQAYISDLEAGRKIPSLDLVVRIADLFSVTTDYLLRDELPVESQVTSPLREVPREILAIKQFGEKLRYLRQQQRLTQTTLAQQVGLASQAYVSDLEAGRKVPSLDLIVRLAELLEVTTDYLLRDTDTTQEPRMES
jgi:transcriptional regulator with XRE-family HTH domain